MTITDVHYDKIKASVHGWMVKDKMTWFENIYATLPITNRPIVAVETGVFLGMSSIAQGVILSKCIRQGNLYAIDAWSADACLEGTNDKANDEWWSNVDYDATLRSFMKSIQDFNLLGIVIPVVGKSVDVADTIPTEIDILHLDSNHSSEVILQELAVYAPRVVKNGYLVADDAKWETAEKGYAKIPEYGFELVLEYFEEGMSFNVYKKL